LTIAFACIAPHGAEVIPELAGELLEAFAETRKAMEVLATRIRRQEPETIVVATPHGLRLEATIGIVTAEFTEGSLDNEDRSVKLRCACDRSLAEEILENAMKSKLPVVGANFGTSEGPGSCMPMDWGTLIPLWFLAGQNSTTKVLIVTPSREIPIQSLTQFGHVIAETAKCSHKRVAFVASADQGHAHKTDGPYGFHQASREYDEIVRQAVKNNNLKPLFELSPQFIDDAKPDSLWQLAILQGVLEVTPMNGELLSYQVPTYYGMLCAAFSPLA
jgi:aromatic ring-opening dioxygenase LigB subunit